MLTNRPLTSLEEVRRAARDRRNLVWDGDVINGATVYRHLSFQMLATILADGALCYADEVVHG